VILTQPVYVGVTEVTQAQYEQVMKGNQSENTASDTGKKLDAGLSTSNHAARKMTWPDAVEFCAKLSQQEELKSFYSRSDKYRVTPLEGTGYRLPTEAEWEFACRAGTTTRYWSGDRFKDLMTVGWFSYNSGNKIHSVGELKANPFGLFDMHGNVEEWVQDSWDVAFYGTFSENAAIDPYRSFLDGHSRSVRGGGVRSNEFICRSSARFFVSNYMAAWTTWGFRVVLAVDGVKKKLE
jgi:formylglycine-generating enzyme required for sulfatase activity